MVAASKRIVTIQTGKTEEVLKLLSFQQNSTSSIDEMIGFAAAQTGDSEHTLTGIYEDMQSAEPPPSVVQNVFSTMKSFIDGFSHGSGSQTLFIMCPNHTFI